MRRSRFAGFAGLIALLWGFSALHMQFAAFKANAFKTAKHLIYGFSGHFDKTVVIEQRNFANALAGQTTFASNSADNIGGADTIAFSCIQEEANHAFA